MPNSSISLQLNWIKTVMSQWAVKEGGVAIIAQDIDKMWETAFETSKVPRCIVAYSGEDVRGDFAVAAATSRIDRHFIALITRATGYTADRGKGFSEQVEETRPFTDLLEEARDLIRALQFDASITEAQPTDPVDFKGIKAVTIDGYPIYAYTIEFSIGTQLATILFDNTPSSIPSAPFNLIATRNNSTSARLDWTIDGWDATFFSVARSINSNTNFTSSYANVAGGTVYYIDTNITASNTYYYKVAGYNTIGTSSYSNAVSIGF